MSYASSMALQDTEGRTFRLRIQTCNMLRVCVMICNRIQRRWFRHYARYHFSYYYYRSFSDN